MLGDGRLSAAEFRLLRGLDSAARLSHALDQSYRQRQHGCINLCHSLIDALTPKLGRQRSDPRNWFVKQVSFFVSDNVHRFVVKMMLRHHNRNSTHNVWQTGAVRTLLTVDPKCRVHH